MARARLPDRTVTGAAAFPVFSLPSAWTGLSGNELVTDRLITVLASSGTTAMTGSLAARAGGEGYQIPVFYDLKTFARMIAKIAHGYAVDFLGLDGDLRPFR